MNWATYLLALAALGVAWWQWHAQLQAAPAGHGLLKGPGGRGIPARLARFAVRVATGRSDRLVVTLALSAGILMARRLAEVLVDGVAQLGALTGLDAAIWAPGTVSLIFTGLVVAGAFDVVVRGLYRSKALRPALRHAPIAVLLPALLVAGGPLFAQASVDLGSRVGGVEAAPACTAPVVPGGAVAGYDGDRLANAAAIVHVGQQMGVPARGQVIALATAMQESGLRAGAIGDGGKANGVFQQHPSYGSENDRRDVEVAARAFYSRLVKVRNYLTLPLWQAAQAVQRSGFPTAYQKHEDVAAKVLGAVTGTTCRP